VFEVTTDEELTHVIYFRESMFATSSAIFNGGCKKQIRWVINHTLLPNNYVDVKKMPSYCKRLAKDYGCDPKKTVVLLTAVPQKYGAWSQKKKCRITAGISNGVPLFSKNKGNGMEVMRYPGTINTVYIMVHKIPEPALIEAYGMVKVYLANTLGDWCKKHNKKVIAGTPTDVTLVLSPKTGKPKEFAGLQTLIEETIAIETRDALLSALSNKYPICKSLRANPA